MLNFIQEKNRKKTYKSIGLLGLSNSLEPFEKILKKIPGTTLEGVFEQNCAENKSNILTNNPFGLISKSDVILAAKSDNQSYNLIVESILNSKHVILSNPYSFEMDEFDYLEKLSNEGLTHLLPFISFEHWDIIENLALLNKSFYHIDIDLKIENPFSEKNFLKQKLFELMFMLHFVTGINMRRTMINFIPFKNEALGLIKLWIEFENACVATISIDSASKGNKFNLHVFAPEKEIECSFEENKIEIIKAEDQKEMLQFDSNTSYLQKTFEMFGKEDPANWFENQLNIFRKTLYQYHKLSVKIPLSKK